MSDMQPGAPQGGSGTQTTASEAPPTQTAGAGGVPPQPPAGGAPVFSGGPGHHDAEGARHGGIWFGAILIAIGVLVLVGQFTRFTDILRLWPLVVIVGGIAQMVRWHGDAPIKRIAEGLGTVAFGLVLLGNTFGIISWTVWLTMLSLWPVLLVGLGIELLGRGLHLDWVRALTNVLFILALVYGVFVLGPGWRGGTVTMNLAPGTGVAYHDSMAHDAAVTTGDASVKVGAIRFTIAGGDQLSAVDGVAPSGDAPRLSSTVTSGVANIQVTDPSAGVVFLPGSDRSLAVTLDRAVTWKDVALDIGAAEAGVDLRELDVQNVSVNVGASSMDLWLGDKASTANVDISGGATSVTVHVPKAAAVTVDSSSGLSSVSVPSNFEHVSGIPVLGNSSWRAAGSGGSTIHITLKSGVSSLEVQTY